MAKRKKASVRGWRRPFEIAGEPSLGGIPAEDMYDPPGSPCWFLGCSSPATRGQVLCGSHNMQKRRGKPLRPIFRRGIKTPTYEELFAVLRGNDVEYST